MKHVCIVGAGVIGLSSGYYLQKNGYKVTIVDNGDGTNNCSFGNAGYISPSHIIPLAAPGMMSRGLKWMLDRESPFYIKPRLSKELFWWGIKFKKAATKSRVNVAAPLLHDMMMQSRTLFEDMVADQNLDVGLNRQGLIMYCKTPAMLKEEAEIGEWAKKLGQGVEMLSKKEAQELNPGLDIDIHGAVYFKDDASITPHIFMQGLRELLISKGVEFIDHCQVEQLEHRGGSITCVKHTSGEVQADEYVLATGSWTPQLLKTVGIKLLIQPGKGYSFVLPSPVVMPKIPGILAEAKIAMTPMQHGLRFAGTMELAGHNSSINNVRVNAIAKSVPKFFPQFKRETFGNIEPWYGLRPCSPDGLPYIGRTVKYQNLLVAAGHAMLGLTLAPFTGKLISEMIANEPLSINSALLDVDRYS